MTDREAKAFYNATAWKHKRVQILERDHYECQDCRKRLKDAVAVGHILQGEDRKIRRAEGGSDEDIKLLSVPKSIVFIVGGAVAIAVGGDVTVDAAARIAGDLGMSQTLIGLTIVSIGTSLPELVTSIVAARKNEVDMALGNAIGSNIFNILMVLGIASAISPMAIITENIIDLCVLIVFTVCVWIFAGTKKKIGRVEGFCMVAFYAAYAIYIIIR